MAVKKLVGQWHQVCRSNYWNAKNMLAQVLMQPQNSCMDKNSHTSPCMVLSIHPSSSQSPLLVSKSMETHEYKDEKCPP